jgi:hypothetical protein
MLGGCSGDEPIVHGAARNASLRELEQETSVCLGAQSQEGFRETVWKMIGARRNAERWYVEG